MQATWVEPGLAEMSYRPDKMLEAFFEESGVRFLPAGVGDISYLVFKADCTICTILRELSSTAAEREYERGRGQLNSIRGRRIKEIIRSAEPVGNRPSVLVLASADPSCLDDAGFFIREGLYGRWQVRGLSDVGTAISGLHDHERRPLVPSAVAVMQSAQPFRLDVYLNKDAEHQLPADALPWGENVRSFRLSYDENGVATGWEAA